MAGGRLRRLGDEGTRAIELAQELDDLNAATAFRIEQAVPAERASDWLDTYLRVANPGAMGIRQTRHRALAALRSLQAASSDETEQLQSMASELEY